MLYKLQSFVKDYDLFSRQIGLHMNKSNFYKTSLGGFCSWIVILFILAFFWSRITSFLNKEEVKVIKNRTFNPDPPYTSLNTERFMFAVNIDQPNSDFLTHPYFNITVKQIVKKKQGNSQVFTYTDIQLEPCTPSHWNSMTQSLANFTDLFKSFGTDFLCPILGQKMQLQGMWGSDIFQYIEVQVEPCISPNDPNQKWNPICASQEEVQEQTKKLGFHGMNFYHSNYVLNADQPVNYFTPYINDKLYFMFVPNKQAQNCDVYFQDIEVMTDESLLPIEDYTDIMFLTQENNDVRETTQLFRSDDKFVTLTLRMSPYVSVINRQYKKASQLLSELGGFIQIVFTCVGILLIKYNNFRFTIDLANNLYQFDTNLSKQKIIQNNKNEKPQDQNVTNLQSCKLNPQKQLNSQFFKDISSINYVIDSQGVKIQKDLAISSSLNFVNQINKETVNQKYQETSTKNKKIKELNQNPVKSQTQIELISNQSLNKIQSIQQSPINFLNTINREQSNINELRIEIEKPIDKFRRAVFKIINKSKIFLDFLKNDKNKFIKQFAQTQNERNSKEKYLINQFHKILKMPYRFDVGIQYFLHKFSLGYFYNNEYNQYITKATDMIHSDLDICPELLNIFLQSQSLDYQHKMNQNSEIKKLYETKSFFCKQQTLKNLKQAYIQKNEMPADLSLINTQNIQNNDNSFSNENTFQFQKLRETPQLILDQLSDSTNRHNYPIIALGEIKNIKTISNITCINPDELKSGFKKDNTSQQFSFHQFSQDLSEVEIPEIEPQSQNIKKLKLQVYDK